MGYETLATMAVALGIAAATPGPGVFAIVSRSVTHGFRDGAAMSAGLILGDLMYFTAALTGWTAVAGLFGEVFFVIRIVAAVVLVLMGARMLIGSFSRAPSAHAPTAAARRAFVAGFLLTLGNPKTILFYLAFLPTFIDLSRVDAWGATDLVGVIVCVVGAVMLTYAAIASRAARCLARPSFTRWMQRGAGTTLIGAGAAVAVRG